MPQLLLIAALEDTLSHFTTGNRFAMLAERLHKRACVLLADCQEQKVEDGWSLRCFGQADKWRNAMV